MKLQTRPIARHNLLIRLFGLHWLLAVLLLSACTHLGVRDLPPPLHHSDSVTQVPDVDVLAVSLAMEEFLDRYVLPYRSPETRLNMLTLAVIANGVLGFSYDDTGTLTAEEAFDRRSGNCVGFANMLVALGRRAGLNAYYQEVVIPPEWSSRSDTILLNKHVNVVLSSPKISHDIDISGIRISPEARRRILSDGESKAWYFTNLGAEALINNDLSKAYSFLVKAIETESNLAEPWVNLGVVFRRNNQLPEAEHALKTALRINPHEYSAMNNLYAMYRRQQRPEEADEFRRKVEKYRKKNPYYLLKLSDAAVEKGEIDESLSLLKRAIRQKQNDHLLHFSLAKSLYLSGQKELAEKSMRRARELAPQLDRYNKPLEQLLSSP